MLPRRLAWTNWFCDGFAAKRSYVLALVLIASLPAAARSADSSQSSTPEPSQEAIAFFERQVRPLLAEHCFTCHGEKKQESDLRLDSHASVIQGGAGGEVVVPGDPDKSSLIQAIRYQDEPKMPPKGKLPDEAIEALTTWVKMGTPWPAETTPTAETQATDVAKSHWAFQPIQLPPVPSVQKSDWPQTPIDNFILARLEADGMQPAEPADRRTLIRRATFDLIGLPPTVEEVEAFVADPATDAYAKVVDRLLASPHYGERWGRYWLDVARYSDSKGYIFTEERTFPYSYTYRDWVIRSLNEDLPYDQFVVQQIAADHLPLGDDKRPLAALGFLTLGRRFLGNKHDIIDDRIDVVARGTLGLTVTCARCHDHKYDPIPTADYYSLYGVFSSSVEKELPIAMGTPEYERDLQTREREFNEFLETTLAETLHRVRTQVGDYLYMAYKTRSQPDTQLFMFVENSGELNRFLVGRWARYLRRTKRQFHPVFGPWHACTEVPEVEMAERIPQLAQQFVANADPQKPINPLVAQLFADPLPTSLQEVAQRYGKLFADVETSWQQALADAKTQGAPAPTALPDAAREELRQVLYAERSPTNVPPRDADDFFEKPAADKLRELRKRVHELRTSKDAPASAMALVDGPNVGNARILVRGNPSNPGEEVPRQFLDALCDENRQPFQQGSGRLELAQAIVARDNPLTARVIVNRVWLHHFGAGLVTTPSDFGLRSDPPSHPELLDYLAWRLMEEGWSLKKLHRLIMLSSVYQQSSENKSDYQTRDPANRLLWRMNRRRLDFEAMRDALLSVAGGLDATSGGPGVNLTSQPFSRRRTVYGLIERQNLPGVFRTFDFASPDTHSPQRYITTVPQQALFLMNNEFVLEQARQAIDRADMESAGDMAENIQRLYRQVLGRVAEDEEVRLGLAFLQAEGGSSAEKPAGNGLSAWEKYAQVLLLSNEFLFVD